MYKKKFSKFNAVMGNIIMTETDTLYVLLTDEFGQRIPKKFQTITPEDWAKYAFDNNKSYYITYYRDEKPFVIVSFSLIAISLSYYEEKEGELFSYMTIWFDRGYLDKTSRKVKFIPFNNNRIFLSQIDKRADLGSGLYFDSQKEKDNVRFDEFVKNNGVTELIEQYGTADLSKNWLDEPKNYLDFEYLFDYEKLFDELPKR
jgi:hypothetical protein